MSCSKHVPSSISFAEIIHGRDATVRVTPDGMIYAVDLVMVMTGLARDQSGLVIRRLSEEKFSSIKMIEKNTGGSGNSRTKLVSFEHAIELIMVLPGQTAKETRVQFANILRRYMAGDVSMHAEIQANAESSSPIAQMARESLGIDEQLTGFKRRREELELLKLEEEIKGMAQSRVITLQDKLEQMRDPHGTKLDDRTRLMFQDTYMNMLMNSQASTEKGAAQAMLTNGPSSNAPISIGSVAAELGYKPSTTDGKRIGIDLKKRYVKLHGRPPSKHDQLCDGRVTQVNSYSQKDRPMLVEALRAYFSPPASLSSGRSDDSD